VRRGRGCAVVAALVVAAALAAAPQARACSCGTAGVTFAIAPAGGAPVARNVRVRVSSRGWYDDDRPAALRLDVVLRAANGRRVAARARVFRDGSGAQVRELVPRALLAPDTTYEVAVEVAVIDRAGRAARTPLAAGRFRTGQVVDGGAPRWDGIVAASLEQKQVPEWSGLCDSARPFGVLRLATPEDPESSSIVFAVWLAPSGGAIDYAQPPVIYVAARADAIGIGAPSKCGHGELPSLEPGTRVGLRAVDQAGNLSPPSDVVLTLAR
jgi:hypothetical protein